jgi:hypothetical protein
MSGIYEPLPPEEPRLTPPDLGRTVAPPPPLISPFIGTPTPVPGPARSPGSAGDISKFALWVIILGLLALAAALVQAFNNLFRWMLGPLWRKTGSRAASPQQLTQWLSNALGSAYGGVDQDVGMMMQRYSDTAGASAAFAIAAAGRIVQLADRVVGLEGHTSTGDQLAARTAARSASAAAGAAAAAQTATNLGKTTRQALRGVQAAQKGEAAHITRLIEPELEQLRSRIHELEKGAATAWDLLKDHEEGFGLTAITAAVAAGLAGLGGSWIECEASQLAGRALCNAGPSAIRNLLSGLLDIGALLALCPLLGELVDAAESSEVHDVLAAFVDGLEAILSCLGITPYTPPAIARADLSPTLFPFAALAPVG